MRAFLSLTDWILQSTRREYIGAFVVIPMLAWIPVGMWRDHITGFTSVPGIAVGIHILISTFIYGRTLHLQDQEHRRRHERYWDGY